MTLPERLQELAENRYSQQEFLKTLFELAVEEQWFDLQHMIQHDMAKAIIADYSYELGKGYLNQDIYFSCWEEVIEIGWDKFCVHTGLSRDKVNSHLRQLREAI
ncbi:hypothetical protein KF707_08160 [Candidatus Obscuribacterales bacterium]|jgi:hypothetical protein|nr:hypothetical protein [Candidatus Obscuribacterales bacterium]MBX3136196.1 hypothetical protein [Candidatus Obscuribacterales bacterium]MBX3148994.1 hypothetical protein [Candidatus Obscuribacterales bacterium]